MVTASTSRLKRQVGVGGAVVLGLGSIIGTGVFVSLAFAAGVTGPAVIAAIGVAAAVATCNGLSSAQLAANHPVSGGTYEYGYRWLRPWLGFSAGWLFLCAKTASAAAAALGFVAYARRLGLPGEEVFDRRLLALITVVAVTILVLRGLRRSNRVNVVLVTVTVGTLVAFVVGGLPTAIASGGGTDPFFAATSGRSPAASFAEACALVFVAFTGYGRIATLGEEIIEPRRNIPRAMIITLVITLLLYAAVAAVAVASVGAGRLGGAWYEPPAPLESVARSFGGTGLAVTVAIGATVAMLGVLLNLVLGLSRIVLAMGRRGDLPTAFGRLDKTGETPTLAVIAVGLLIAALVCWGDVKTTWSFSAFTVLLYYALTNLAAIRLSPAERLYPAWISWLGLAACGFLAFWVEQRVWLVGTGVLVAGLLVRAVWKWDTTRVGPGPKRT